MRATGARRSHSQAAEARQLSSPHPIVHYTRHPSLHQGTAHALAVIGGMTRLGVDAFSVCNCPLFVGTEVYELNAVEQEMPRRGETAQSLWPPATGALAEPA